VSDVWTFGPAKDSQETYADSTSVPHRAQQVLLNGKPIGDIEIHCHRRRGPDGVVDVSYGLTTVVFSVPAGGS